MFNGSFPHKHSVPSNVYTIWVIILPPNTRCSSIYANLTKYYSSYREDSSNFVDYNKQYLLFCDKISSNT